MKRKDGKERIVLMQLGPVRYKDLSKVSSELMHKVLVQETGISSDDLSKEHTTNELYDYLYINAIRNMQIVMDIRNCLDENRYPIVLTERKEHIDLLEKELSPYVRVYKLHGGLKKKEVRIYDYVDSRIDAAMKMFEKRSKGYRSMGYQIIE